mgnify:CR=1 FL=1
MKGVDTIARIRREFFVRGRTIKEIVREAEALTFQDAMNRITKRQFESVDVLYDSEDQMEGARAFSEKRDPGWKGK